MKNEYYLNDKVLLISILKCVKYLWIIDELEIDAPRINWKCGIMREKNRCMKKTNVYALISIVIVLCSFQLGSVSMLVPGPPSPIASNVLIAQLKFTQFHYRFSRYSEFKMCDYMWIKLRRKLNVWGIMRKMWIKL